MDAVEQARGEKYADSLVRQRFLAGRSWLRELVSQRTGAQPGQLRSRYHCPACSAVDHGRPGYELDGQPLPLPLSFSRSGGWAVAVLGEQSPMGSVEHHRVGIDVELISRFEGDELDDIVYTAAERAAIRRLTAPQRVPLRAALWARKEAVLKAAGIGLLLEPSTLDVQGRIVRVGDNPYEVDDVPPAGLGLPAGFVAAVARGR